MQWSSVMKDIKSTRKNIDKEFSVIFEQAEWVAAKVETRPSPSIPHTAKKQVNRDNTEADSSETYSQAAFTCSKLTKATLEQGVKYVQS